MHTKTQFVSQNHDFTLFILPFSSSIPYTLLLLRITRGLPGGGKMLPLLLLLGPVAEVVALILFDLFSCFASVLPPLTNDDSEVFSLDAGEGLVLELASVLPFNRRPFAIPGLPRGRECLLGL